MLRVGTRVAPCVLLALCSAVLLPLALPNDLYSHGNPLVGLVALAPLFAALAITPSYRAASAVGALFGAVSTFFVHYWLLYFHEFSVWTISGVVLGYAAYHALLGPVLRAVALRMRGVRPLALGAAWTVYEYLKSSGFLAFPWGLVSHPFSDVLPLIQVADIYGVWGVSLLAAWVNALAAEVILRGCRAAGEPLSVAPGPPGRRGALRHRAVARLRAVAPGPAPLGGGVGPHHTGAGAAQRRPLAGGQRRRRGRRSAGPHAARPRRGACRSRGLERNDRPLPRARRAARALSRALSAALRAWRRFSARRGTPLLLGSPFQAAGAAGYENAALLLAPDGRLLGSYAKQQLVPIAERVPFWSLEAVRRFFEGSLGLTEGWTPGSGPVTLDVPLAGGGSRAGRHADLLRGRLPRPVPADGALRRQSPCEHDERLMVAPQVGHGSDAGRRALPQRRERVRAGEGDQRRRERGDRAPRRDLGRAADVRVGLPRVEVPLYAGGGRTAYAVFGDVLPLALAYGLAAGFAAQHLRRRREGAPGGGGKRRAGADS